MSSLTQNTPWIRSSSCTESTRSRGSGLRSRGGCLRIRSARGSGLQRSRSHHRRQRGEERRERASMNLRTPGETARGKILGKNPSHHKTLKDKAGGNHSVIEGWLVTQYGADKFDRDGLRAAAKTVTTTIKEGRALAHSGYPSAAHAKFQYAIRTLSELAKEHPTANWLRARISNCQNEAQKIKYQMTKDKRRGRGVHPREPVRPVGPAASSGPIKCRTRDGDEDGRYARGARGGRNSPWSARKRRRPSKGAGRR
mmetsp:Transcript_37541/g.99793  ORF Transcript_37541/g.99793 Transcript_37541/m.99793 type:complete len:255 (-) Transcript_37541:96-860(-)